LQKRIILHLAKNKPQTINEIAKGIEGHYKSTWRNFKILVKENYIQNVMPPKEYQGRKYPRFWITDIGIYVALFEGAKPEPLLKKTLEIYPENQKLQFLIDVFPALEENALNVLYMAALNKEALTLTQMALIFAAQMQERSNPKHNEFHQALKWYPEVHQLFRDYISTTRKNLERLYR
jgi:signal recognition particle subunit SEC65